MDFDTTSRTVKLGQGTLHYHEAGEGPLLVLLHGSGSGVSGWANFGANLPRFAQQFRCLVLDLPGYGLSDAVAGQPIMVGVDAVRNFLKELGIEKAHILGNSYGGIVGTRLAADSPDVVDRLATVGGFGFTPFSPFPAEGIIRLVEFVEDPTRERLLAWMRSMVFDPAVLTEELVEMRYKTAMSPEGIADLAFLSRIEAPTLITWGRDDRVNPLDGAFLPMRAIRRCELHVFPDCGHWAMIERKEEFEQVVSCFLGR